MNVKVKKWGNSPAVRIPASVMQASHLEVDDLVDVREEAGCIVIEPVRRKTYDLSRLIREISAENQHLPVDFGRPQGKEVW